MRFRRAAAFMGFESGGLSTIWLSRQMLLRLTSGYAGFVAQPPLPLQVFLPLHPCVAGLAAALPFTCVFSLAVVSALVPHCLEGNSRGSWFAGCESADRHRSGHQTGNSCAREECFRCIHLVLLVLAFEFLNLWPSATLRPPKFGKCARNDLLTEITLRPSLWSLEIILSDRSSAKNR